MSSKAWFSSHGLAAEAPQNCQNRIADLYIDIEPEKFVFMQDVQDTDTESVSDVVSSLDPLIWSKKVKSYTTCRTRILSRSVTWYLV